MTAYRRITVIVLIWLLGSGHAMAESHRSYQDCRSCHTDIFNLWSGSRHAKSFSNPSFQAAYMTTNLSHGESSSRYCLRCHAPTAHSVGAFDPVSPIAADGISCLFCHAITSVNEGQGIEAYYNIDTAGTIYGPYEVTDTTGHRAAYSPLHLRAELCAGCHEFRNSAGVPILETYTEWSESAYPGNEVYCQNCHMPIMTDLSVVNGQKVSAYYVTAHEFQGGHSNINLSTAAKLETVVKRTGSRLDVTVSITNAESGHKLPTGIPIRRLILNVALKSGINAELSSARRVYRKALVDKYGTIIETAPEMFLNAADVYSDNRIAPHETRIEKFGFVVPRSVNDYWLEVVLNYESTRPMLKEESVVVEMARNVIPSESIR